ncbi:MAG: glutamine--tRNA ligase/YqeY domain fusion protein [SAR324 cluster bacterium]|nr:glutamine--tRNA ligase/YqeY domain fusion protein [SAR324 cluster bacterium]
MSNITSISASNFIRNIISEDVKANKNGAQVVTRFPPEPNGYLHIGHAKAICLNFGMAAEFKGKCYLRFDDTNPGKESVEYIKAMQEDVRWLGFDWEDRLRYASSYFDQLYEWALELIKKGKAYVDSLSAEEIRTYRGTLKEPGKDSPFRNRSIEENLRMFEAMQAGKFDDGTHVLRAKIDMSSPNMNMRDPTLYRIRRMTHHQTGDKWIVYPMYDFTHGLSDAIEGVTHSLCTLEFEDHRPLYDWILDQLDAPCHPQQIEFARLALEYTMTSKRKLTRLVEEAHVSGWDDPRMHTLSGMRRRGYPPASIRNFCERIGVSKNNSTTEMFILEDCVRQELDVRAPRVMGVLRPLRLVIENYPEDQIEELDARSHPNDESMGTRKLIFSRELYIDREDFVEEPPPKYKRLSPGSEVRLRNAYVIRCDRVIKDEQSGEVKELRCSYDSRTLGVKPEGRKIGGVIHWVSIDHSVSAEVRLYDRLFMKANPNKEIPGEDITSYLNPNSLEILTGCRLEASLNETEQGSRFQFEREGYFFKDPVDSKEDALVFNRIVTLRDAWTKK